MHRRILTTATRILTAGSNIATTGRRILTTGTRIVTAGSNIATVGRSIVTTAPRIVNRECAVAGNASGYFCLKVFDRDVCCYCLFVDFEF